MDRIEFNVEGCCYCVCGNSVGESLNCLPWGDARFDVVVLLCDRDSVFSETVKKSLDQLVLKNSEWFEVLGPDAEGLHDYIDNASVRLGRQTEAGDGSPVTTWDEAMLEPEDQVDFIFSSLLGGNENRVLLIAGDGERKRELIEILRRRIKALGPCTE